MLYTLLIMGHLLFSDNRPVALSIPNISAQTCMMEVDKLRKVKEFVPAMLECIPQDNSIYVPGEKK